MRTFTYTLLSFALLPVAAVAHVGAPDSTTDAVYGPGMMHLIEDRALGDETHEELEELMVKMMSGTLTDNEADRLTELMNEYPGPYGMMMNRMSNTYGTPYAYTNPRGYGGHMMGDWGYGHSGWSTLGSLAGIVWLLAGIGLLIWIVRELSAGRRRSDETNR